MLVGLAPTADGRAAAAHRGAAAGRRALATAVLLMCPSALPEERAPMLLRHARGVSARSGVDNSSRAVTVVRRLLCCGATGVVVIDMRSPELLPCWRSSDAALGGDNCRYTESMRTDGGAASRGVGVGEMSIGEPPRLIGVIGCASAYCARAAAASGGVGGTLGESADGFCGTANSDLTSQRTALLRKHRPSVHRSRQRTHCSRHGTRRSEGLGLPTASVATVRAACRVQAGGMLLTLSMNTMRQCCRHHAWAKPPSHCCRIKSAESFVQQQTAGGSLPCRVVHRTYNRTSECALTARPSRRTLCGGSIRCASTTALSISIAHACGHSAAAQHKRLQRCSAVHSGATVTTVAYRVALCVPQYYGGGAGWRVGAHGCTGYNTRSVLDGHSISITHSILVEY